MKNPYTNNSQIGLVNSFLDLITTDFKGDKNALCLFRELEGDFKEIVDKLQLKETITEVHLEDLLALDLSDKGNLARLIILKDMQSLTDFDASPTLNLLKCYDRDEDFDFIPTDVYSFHVDRSPIATDTFLCTYHGAASDIIANNEVEQKILIPEIRKKLEDLHNDSNDDFEEFLKDNYFDLHYQPKQDATVINLGIGHLWRLAVDHPEQKVLPCVHRAPVEKEGEYRLLLIC